ncbi:MAG TPA: hypothetical protein EYP02_04525, partial [Sulfurovum sp.]|nr:hypothetical protein [Sulfurovum sp.]
KKEIKKEKKIKYEKVLKKASGKKEKYDHPKIRNERVNKKEILKIIKKFRRDKYNVSNVIYSIKKYNINNNDLEKMANYDDYNVFIKQKIIIEPKKNKKGEPVIKQQSAKFGKQEDRYISTINDMKAIGFDVEYEQMTFQSEYGPSVKREYKKTGKFIKEKIKKKSQFERKYTRKELIKHFKKEDTNFLKMYQNYKMIQIISHIKDKKSRNSILKKLSIKKLTTLLKNTLKQTRLLERRIDYRTIKYTKIEERKFFSISSDILNKTIKYIHFIFKLKKINKKTMEKIDKHIIIALDKYDEKIDKEYPIQMKEKKIPYMIRFIRERKLKDEIRFKGWTEREYIPKPDKHRCPPHSGKKISDLRNICKKLKLEYNNKNTKKELINKIIEYKIPRCTKKGRYISHITDKEFRYEKYTKIDLGRKDIKKIKNLDCPPHSNKNKTELQEIIIKVGLKYDKKDKKKDLINIIKEFKKKNNCK